MYNTKSVDCAREIRIINLLHAAYNVKIVHKCINHAPDIPPYLAILYSPTGVTINDNEEQRLTNHFLLNKLLLGT